MSADPTTAKTGKPWAVLAYTVADDKSGGSPLDAAAKVELKALADAADFDQIYIAAQVDFNKTPGVYRGVLTDTPRAIGDVEPDDHHLWRTVSDTFGQDRFQMMSSTELNAARADVLQDFLRFGQRDCPAQRYVVTFYGHAYGPMGLFFDADARKRDANTLRLNDLASSIEMIDGKAAVVVFRDCFMNTLETAYQLRQSAELMLASQSVVPIAGVWPWLGFMTALMPGAASSDVARALAVQLAFFLKDPANRGPFVDVPYSLIDLAEAEFVAGPLKALTDALDSARTDPARLAACAAALEGARVGFPDDHTNPGDPALLDVPTMCERLAALGSDPVVGPALALGDVVKTRLVRWHHSQKQTHQGTSLYYQPVTPRDIQRSYILSGDAEDAAKDSAAYRELALCVATGWDRVALNPLTMPQTAPAAQAAARGSRP
jgi:hypothetical protein